MKEKKCKRCHVTKSLDQYNAHPTTKDGKQQYCQKCMTSIGRESRAKAKAKKIKEGTWTDGRGKAKKPRRSGRKALENPLVVYPENRPTKEEMNKGQCGKPGNMEEIVYEMIDLIRTGVSLDGCKEIFGERINPNTGRVFAPRFLQTCSLKANALIQEVYEINKTELVSLHIKRYDREIQRLLSIETPKEADFETPKGYWRAFNQKVIGMSDCLDALQQKERLLGIHTKSFRLVINSEEETVLKDRAPEIDISLLSLDEKIELNDLIEKTRRTEDEISGVILRQDIRTTVTEDIEHEVVEEKSNIDRIENREPEVVTELAPEGLALELIKEKMNVRLQHAAKEALLKHRSKTVEFDEIKDIR